MEPSTRPCSVTGPDGDLDPQELQGQTLGEYHILAVLGSGGMGVVFEAKQLGSKRNIALKTLRGLHATDEEMRRFRREFQLLAQLTHPGIARFYDAGTHQVAGQTLPYYTMELVEGGIPITRYAREAKLGRRAVLELARQCTEAVHYGHTKGIIHRDLKPGNLLVDANGSAKVIDFGLARPLDCQALGLSVLDTREGSLLGTLRYMSPEHLSGKPHSIDVRSDVYSLGCVLWELLSGSPPNDTGARSLPAAIAHLQEATPKPDLALPRELRWILTKAVSRDPARRYRSAAELGDDIGRFLEGDPIDAAPPSRLYGLQTMARKHRLPLVAVASIIAALSIGLVRARAATERSEQARMDAVAARDDAQVQGNISRAINQFADRMFGSLDTYGLGPEVKVKDLLKEHVPLLERIADPRARLIARGQLGLGYFKLGDLPMAQQLLGDAKDAAAELARANLRVSPEHRGALGRSARGPGPLLRGHLNSRS